MIRLILISILIFPFTLHGETMMENFNNSPENRWQFFTDQVMGGKSDGKLNFVSEKNISSLDTNKEIWFTPSSTSQDSIAAYVNSISKSPINNFDMYPMVTSIFDGPIAASENPSGGIRSEQAYYKVTLDLEDNTSAMDNKMLGFVNMGIKSRSYFKRFIDFSSATLIRELNF